MKNTTKVLACALVALALVFAAGCNGNSESDSTSGLAGTTWELRDDEEDISLTLYFASNGTYTLTMQDSEESNEESGTWSLSGTTLTISGGDFLGAERSVTYDGGNTLTLGQFTFTRAS